MGKGPSRTKLMSAAYFRVVPEPLYLVLGRDGSWIQIRRSMSSKTLEIRDDEGTAMVRAVVEGECEPCILADFLEDRYECGELPRLLRECVPEWM